MIGRDRLFTASTADTFFRCLDIKGTADGTTRQRWRYQMGSFVEESSAAVAGGKAFVLAADGAKLALWELYHAGYRCVAFVHDEVVTELPVEWDHAQHARRIDQILCKSMEALTGEIPIACEYALTDRWYKQAEAVFDDQQQLQLWQPHDE